MFRFHLRSLLELTLIIAIVLAWWADYSSQQRTIDELEQSIKDATPQQIYVF